MKSQSTNHSQDRRQFSRVEMDGHCQLTLGDRQFNAELVDISLKGALLKTAPNCTLALTEEPQLTIILGQDQQIVMLTRCIHKQDGFIGLTCQSLDLDSMYHLRRLMEINLGDKAAVEEELNHFYSYSRH